MNFITTGPLCEKWEKFCKANNIRLTPVQEKMVMDLLTNMGTSTRFQRFMLARCTGKTYVLENFERFCHEIKLL